MNPDINFPNVVAERDPGGCGPESHGTTAPVRDMTARREARLHRLLHDHQQCQDCGMPRMSHGEDHDFDPRPGRVTFSIEAFMDVLEWGGL